MENSKNPEGAPSLSLPNLERQGGDVDFQSDPPLLTTKRRGEIAEAAFLHKASSLGFSVAKPWGDSDRYDFILDSAGHLSRVQVKTASRVGDGAYSIHACGNDPGRTYTREEIDFLMAYIVSENLWYVLPVELFVRVRHVKLHPFRTRPLSRYEKYREAWHSMHKPRSIAVASSREEKPRLAAELRSSLGLLAYQLRDRLPSFCLERALQLLSIGEFNREVTGCTVYYSPTKWNKYALRNVLDSKFGMSNRLTVSVATVSASRFIPGV